LIPKYSSKLYFIAVFLKPGISEAFSVFQGLICWNLETISYTNQTIQKVITLLLAFSVVLHLMLLLLIDPQLYIPTT
jgi:hypothetical protein